MRVINFQAEPLVPSHRVISFIVRVISFIVRSPPRALFFRWTRRRTYVRNIWLTRVKSRNDKKNEELIKV